MLIGLILGNKITVIFSYILKYNSINSILLIIEIERSMKKLIITQWVLYKRVLCMWSEKELGKHADLGINYMHEEVSDDQGSII